MNLKIRQALAVLRKHSNRHNMEVPKEILNEIADSLDAGFKCFIHRDTFEVVTYLDPDRYPDMDPKDWKEEISKVKKA